MNKTISPTDEQNSPSFQVPGFVHSVLWKRPGVRGQSHRKSYGQHKAAEPVLPYNEADGGGEKDLSCSPLSAA